MATAIVMACAFCGKETKRALSLKRNGKPSDKIFCNRDCYNQYRIKARGVCAACKAPIPPGRIRQKYCSAECWSTTRKAKSKRCKNCNTLFTPVKLHRGSGKMISYNGGKLCSKECHIQWIKNNPERKAKISRAFKGANHPQWQGGKSFLDISSRGPNWQKQRQRALKRDGFRCTDCGIHDDECLAAYGRRLDVNHIRPFHNFGSYKQANTLSNLETLCASCHRKHEAQTWVQIVLPLAGSEKRRHSGGVRGENVNTAKLTAVDVLNIRRRAKAGEKQTALASRFGVRQATINAIVLRKSWRHV